MNNLDLPLMHHGYDEDDHPDGDDGFHYADTHTIIDAPEHIYETEKGLLIRHELFAEDVWLPKSQITHAPEHGILLPKWLLRKKLEKHGV